jgi:transcriptional regulator with XRE-family HTH domain
MGLSPRDLAKVTGLSLATIRRTERGEWVQSATARKIVTAPYVRPSRMLGRVVV